MNSDQNILTFVRAPPKCFNAFAKNAQI